MMGYQSGDDGVPGRGWGNNINQSPKWNSSLLDFYFNSIQLPFLSHPDGLRLNAFLELND